MDTAGSFSARAQHALSPAFTVKGAAQIQPAEGSMFIAEGVLTGSDYSANVKAYNPNVRIELSVVFLSLTPL